MFICMSPITGQINVGKTYLIFAWEWRWPLSDFTVDECLKFANSAACWFEHVKTVGITASLHGEYSLNTRWIHFVGGPNRRITNPRWRTAAILKKTAISPQRLDRFAQNLARWRILALRRVWAVKISNFWKSKMADGRHLKNQKPPYFLNGLTNLHKIWHGAAFWPSEGYGQLKFPNFKNPRWRKAAILKNQ